MPTEPLTADTVTDEQIVGLLEDSQYRGWLLLAADCQIALHGESLPRRTRQHNKYTRKSVKYKEARKRVADAINARRAQEGK